MLFLIHGETSGGWRLMVFYTLVGTVPALKGRGRNGREGVNARQGRCATLLAAPAARWPFMARSALLRPFMAESVSPVISKVASPASPYGLWFRALWLPPRDTDGAEDGRDQQHTHQQRHQIRRHQRFEKDEAGHRDEQII